MIEFKKLHDFFKEEIKLEDKKKDIYYDLHLHTKASDGFLNINLLLQLLI